jgi:hypothetical protein
VSTYLSRCASGHSIFTIILPLPHHCQGKSSQRLTNTTTEFSNRSNVASPRELLLPAAHDTDTDTEKTAQEGGTTDPDTAARPFEAPKGFVIPELQVNQVGDCLSTLEDLYRGGKSPMRRLIGGLDTDILSIYNRDGSSWTPRGRRDHGPTWEVSPKWRSHTTGFLVASEQLKALLSHLDRQIQNLPSLQTISQTGHTQRKSTRRRWTNAMSFWSCESRDHRGLRQGA